LSGNHAVDRQRIAARGGSTLLAGRLDEARQVDGTRANDVTVLSKRVGSYQYSPTAVAVLIDQL
jgi:hypothetical protein